MESKWKIVRIIYIICGLTYINGLNFLIKLKSVLTNSNGLILLISQLLLGLCQWALSVLALMDRLIEFQLDNNWVPTLHLYMWCQLPINLTQNPFVTHHRQEEQKSSPKYFFTMNPTGVDLAPTGTRFYLIQIMCMLKLKYLMYLCMNLVRTCRHSILSKPKYAKYKK